MMRLRRRRGRRSANSATLFDQFQFSRALEAAWALVAAVDKYIVENEPWALGEKQDEDSRVASGDGALHRGGSAADCDGAGASRDAGCDREDLGCSWGWETSRSSRLSELAWGQLPLGTKLGEVQPVFPRADKSAIERMQKMEEEQRSAPVAERCGSRRPQPANASQRLRRGDAVPQRRSQRRTKRFRSTISPRSNCAWDW